MWSMPITSIFISLICCHKMFPHSDFRKLVKMSLRFFTADHPASRAANKGARLCEPQHGGNKGRVRFAEGSVSREAAAGPRPALRQICAACGKFHQCWSVSIRVNFKYLWLEYMASDKLILPRTLV